MTDDKEAAWAKIAIRQPIDELIKHGPSLKIGILPVPSIGNAVGALAQIDTGAAGTGLSPRLVSALSLPPTGDGEIREPGREIISVKFYRVRLILPSRLDVEVEVAGLPSLAEPHDILIGRDILAEARLLVDFTDGITRLHFKTA